MQAAVVAPGTIYAAGISAVGHRLIRVIGINRSSLLRQGVVQRTLPCQHGLHKHAQHQQPQQQGSQQRGR